MVINFLTFLFFLLDIFSYTNKADLQKRIESVRFNGGTTKTGAAMNLALHHFKDKQRDAKTTPRVRIQETLIVYPFSDCIAADQRLHGTVNC